MTPLRFNYRAADGELIYCRIHPWSDQGQSIQGFDHPSSRFGVYQKDHIAEYLQHTPLQPIPPPPPPPPFDPIDPNDPTEPPEPGGPPSPLPPHPFDRWTLAPTLAALSGDTGQAPPCDPLSVCGIDAGVHITASAPPSPQPVEPDSPTVPQPVAPDDSPAAPLPPHPVDERHPNERPNPST